MHLRHLKLFSYRDFRTQIKILISLIMICHIIVLHQSTVLCKEEGEDQGVVVPEEGGVVVIKDQIDKK